MRYILKNTQYKLPPKYCSKLLEEIL